MLHNYITVVTCGDGGGGGGVDGDVYGGLSIASFVASVMEKFRRMHTYKYTSINTTKKKYVSTFVKLSLCKHKVCTLCILAVINELHIYTRTY